MVTSKNQKFKSPFFKLVKQTNIKIWGLKMYLRRMYLVYLDLGYDTLNLDESKIFKLKTKAEMYRDLKQLKVKYGKYRIKELQAIW